MKVEEKLVLENLLWALKRKLSIYQDILSFYQNDIKTHDLTRKDVDALSDHVENMIISYRVSTSSLNDQIQLVEDSMSKDTINGQQNIFVRLHYIISKFDKNDPIRKQFMCYYEIDD